MTKRFLYLIALFLIPTLLLTNCKKDNEETPTVDYQKVMTDYMTANQMDLNKILDGFVMAAPETGDVSAYYVIDLRKAEDFAMGHIADAHRVDLANVLAEAANAGAKPILVVCYTGQTATFTTALLRMSGYTSAKALKWGMSGWNPVFDKWTANIASLAEGNANWSTAAAPTNLTYAHPTFTSTATTGDAILKERVAAVISGGFKTVTADDALMNPGNYFINNYFSEADYTGFGHINGAFRINPLLIGESQVLFLDPSKTIVTYCYTGQTSAAITAFLRVLGYDAKSMLFGMNRLYNSNTAWVSNKWTSGTPKNLPYVTN
ncbi:MAG: rhodanese-like domain-containing protein [Bacteroidales bacterium]|nr:rhodanese-like domain-containing protein [Bacteroidales bacterium]MDD3664899.1 rhodanese-like domain-containing protein [Bacteroidales bacterium]